MYKSDGCLEMIFKYHVTIKKRDKMCDLFMTLCDTEVVSLNKTQKLMICNAMKDILKLAQIVTSGILISIHGLTQNDALLCTFVVYFVSSVCVIIQQVI